MPIVCGLFVPLPDWNPPGQGQNLSLLGVSSAERKHQSLAEESNVCLRTELLFFFFIFQKCLLFERARASWGETERETKDMKQALR